MINPQASKSLWFFRSSGEALELVPGRSYGCPSLGSVPGQAEWGPEQPGLAEGVHACGCGLEINNP